MSQRRRRATRGSSSSDRVDEFALLSGSTPVGDVDGLHPVTLASRVGTCRQSPVGSIAVLRRHGVERAEAQQPASSATSDPANQPDQRSLQSSCHQQPQPAGPTSPTSDLMEDRRETDLTSRPAASDQ